MTWLSNFRDIFVPLSYAVDEICVQVKVKVQVTLEQTTKAQMGSRGIALFVV